MYNQDFFNYIKPYLIKLREKIGDDFIVFGSAPLYLLGVVEFIGTIHDLDITTKDYSLIPKDAREVVFQKDPNQKLYKIFIDEMEIDIGVSWLGYEDFFKRIFADPIIVEGFKFANLDVVEEWKKTTFEKYGRPKDGVYLDKIKKFREYETIIDFTKVKKDGVSIDDVLKVI